MKRNWIFALIISSLLLTTPALSALDVDSLLRVSVGGDDAVDTLRHLRSYRIEGQVTLSGLKDENAMSGAFELWYSVPFQYFVKMNFEMFSIVQGYDGKVAWQTGLSGESTVLEGMEKREILKGLYFDSYSFLFRDRLPGEKEYRGDTVINGRQLHVVAFYPLNDDTVLAFFDSETGQQKMQTTKLDNIEALQFSQDYLKVSGVNFPSKVEIIADKAGLKSVVTIDRIKMNPKIDPARFSMPAAAREMFFPPKTDSVIIPFEYARGHIHLPVRLNGQKKVWFILDSGSSASFLHKPIADQLSLPQVGSLPARGVGGFQNVDLVKVDSIQIGELVLYDQIVGSGDLTVLDKRLGEDHEFGGLLGYDFLARFPIMIDYNDSSLTVYQPAGFVAPDSGTEIPFHLTMSIPTIHGELNGIGGDYLVDLGNSFGLIVHHGFAQQHDLMNKLDDVRENADMLHGVGNSVAGKNAYAATFRIGDIALQSLRVILPEASEGVAGSEELAGNIGNMILENFDVLLDYQRGRLILYAPDSDTSKLEQN